MQDYFQTLLTDMVEAAKPLIRTAVYDGPEEKRHTEYWPAAARETRWDGISNHRILR